MSRQASIYLDDIETMERAGELLFKHIENAAAIRLLAIALRLRGQTGLGAELTERETRGADGSEWPPRPRSVNFACSADDIDESGGLADVVPLDSWSKRVHHVQQATIHGAGSE